MSLRPGKLFHGSFFSFLVSNLTLNLLFSVDNEEQSDDSCLHDKVTDCPEVTPIVQNGKFILMELTFIFRIKKNTIHSR